MAVYVDGFQMQSVVQESLRTVLVGQRYEYKILEERGQYFVQCSDTERPRHTHKHGPFSLDEANVMIDARIMRDEALKR